MNVAWQRARGTVLLGAALILVFVSVLAKPGLFAVFGVNPLKPAYADLIAILAAGEAQQLGRDPYEHNPLDPYNRPHVYGPWWLVTGDLGLVRSDAWWLGSLMAIATTIIGAVLLAPRNKRTWFMAAALLISPPVLFAMERGNNDLVVLFLLFGAAWLATRQHWFGAAVGGGLLLITAALKLYPIAALPMLTARATSRGRAIGWVALTAIGCATVLLISWATYRMVAAMAPEPLTIFGYGAKLTYYVFLTISSQRLWLVLGATTILVITAWLAWKHRGDLWRLVPPMGFDAACYFAGASCWALCYVSTINFPYRMVLFLLPARHWLSAYPNPAAKLQLGVAIALAWTQCLKGNLFKFDASENVFGGSPVAWLGYGAEQALAFVLTMLLIISLFGSVSRRFGLVKNASTSETGSENLPALATTR